MASEVVRAMKPETPGAAEFNGLQAVFSGQKGGRIRLVGDDGIALNPVGGATVSTGNYALYIKSAAGLHLSIDSAAGASLLTVNDTAGITMDHLSLTSYLAIGMGKQLRLYDAVGTDYVQLTSSADGGLVLGGSGAGAGGMAMTYLALGTNPAQSQALRLPNAANIAWRNAANSGDIASILVYSDDNLYVGTSAGNPSVIVRASTDIRLRLSSDHIIVALSKVTLGVAADTLAFFGVTGTTRAGPITLTYATTATTLNAYTPDIENAAYVGLVTGAPGNPYANVVDLNALRVAYENMRNGYENLLQHYRYTVGRLQSYGLFS